MRTLAATLFLLVASTASAADPLINQLGDDSFDRREAASAALRKRGWSAAELLRANKDNSDPEIRTRARLLYEYAVEDRLVAWEPYPMIDACYYCLIARAYLTDSLIAARLEQYLEASGGRDGLPYTRYRDATRLLVREWLDRGVPAWQIDARLTLMHLIDGEWIRHHKLTDVRLMELAVRPWMREAFPRWRDGK